jgi:hypothetical protein
VANVIPDGEAQLGADGVLQGWCWNPNRPTERLVLEILINERIVSTFVASRFREDLRDRDIGDGYYGFIATLTKSLVDAGDNFVISARERGSGSCFWRQVTGESGLPQDFAARFAEVRHRFSRVARSSRFRTLGTSSFTSRVSTELGALGMHLRPETRLDNGYLPPIARARSALLQQTARVDIEIIRSPKVAVIIIADSTSNDVLSTISAVVPTLTIIGASLLLIDRGSNADVALAPSIFGNLRYIFDPRYNLGSMLAVALKYSHGDLLIVIRNPGESIVQGLPEIVAQMHDSSSVYMNARSVEMAYGISAESSEDLSRWRAKFSIGLEFAGRRELFAQFRGFSLTKDRLTGLEDVDLAIRAIHLGIEFCVWDEPNLMQKNGLRVEASH